MEYLGLITKDHDLVTKIYVDNKTTEIKEDTIEEISSELNVLRIVDLVIPTTGWTTVQNDEYNYQLQLTCSSSKAEYYPYVAIAKKDLWIAENTRLCPTCSATDGYLIFWAKSIPTDAIDVRVAFMGQLSDMEGFSANIGLVNNSENILRKDSNGILYAEQINPWAYEGADLTVSFASEISNYSDEWAWIQARIGAGNFRGIYVGDYIPITTSNNVTLNAQVAGINTYKNYGDTAVGNHIDFICKELWPTNHAMNLVDFNNGISSEAPYPWLVSDLYHWINSLSGTVPSAAEIGGGTGTAVNYTANGIYYYLPTKLKNVIIEKRLYLPKRYSSSGLLTDDNNAGWANIGKLWIPSELEISGNSFWNKSEYGCVGFQQYPIFMHTNYVKNKPNGIRSAYCLISTCSSSSTSFLYVTDNGVIHTKEATSNQYTIPVCFRVGGA